MASSLNTPDLSGNAPNVLWPKKLVFGVFSGTGVSQSLDVFGDVVFNMSASDAVSVSIERSVDGGITWQLVTMNAAGDPATFTASVNPIVFNEPIKGVKYRVNCGSFTANPVAYRLEAAGVIQ